MTLQTIAITSIETAATQGGRNPGAAYRIVHSNGDKYYCFDSKLFPILDHAKSVGAEITEGKNGSKRITAAVEREAAPAGQAPGDLRDLNIRRQVALKCAVDAAGPHVGEVTTVEYLAEVILVAERFIAWLDPSTDDDDEAF